MCWFQGLIWMPHSIMVCIDFGLIRIAFQNILHTSCAMENWSTQKRTQQRPDANESFYWSGPGGFSLRMPGIEKGF